MPDSGMWDRGDIVKNFIKGLKPGYRVLIGLLFIVSYNASAKLYYPESLILGLVIGVAFLIFLFLCLTNKYEDPKKHTHEAEQNGVQLETSGSHCGREESAPDKKVNADERGKIFTKVAGVTFENDDGSSRQKYLREAYASPYGETRLERYEFNGEPAIRVMFDDWCIGNVPRAKINEVLAVMNRITGIVLTVSDNCFDDDESEDESHKRKPRKDTIYSATLMIYYKL